MFADETSAPELGYTLFAILDRKRNLWWFEVPVALLRKGQPDWVNLLLHTPESDELQHL